jgi:AsmA protein
MKKLFKILAVTVLLLITGAFLAGTLIDPNDFRDEIEARFEAATGRRIHIGGDLRFAILPRPGLRIAGLSLPGPAGLGAPDLADLDMLHLYPRLLPLLSGRLEIALVRAEGLRLHLFRDETGRANWAARAIAGASEAGTGGFPARFPVARARPLGFLDVAAAEAPPAAARLLIHRVEVTDARVIWEDRDNERRVEVGGLAGFAGPVAPGEHLALRFSGSLVDAAGQPSAGIEVAAGVLHDGPGRSIRLEPLTLEFDGLGLGNDLVADATVRAALEADLGARRYLAEALELDLRIIGDALAGGRVDANAGARVVLDLASETLKVSGLSVRSGTLSAHGSALGQTVLSAPVLTGSLTLDELDLRAWVEQRGLSVPRTADAETFRRFALRACWRLEEGLSGLENMVLDIDQTRFNGYIERVAIGSPVFRFDLVADRLDLDRYLPPARGTHAGSGRTSSWQAPAPGVVAMRAGLVGPGAPPSGYFIKASAAARARARVPDLISWQSIADLGLDGRLRIGELRLARLRFGDADLQIRGERGRIDVEDRVERFYAGRMVGALALDERGAEPRVALFQRADGIEIGPLIAELAGEDRLTGRGEITLDLTAAGRNTESIRRSLAGDLDVHLTEAEVRGFNPDRLIREAAARLKGGKSPSKLPAQTQFSDIRATAEIERGVLTNRDLVASADHLRITGKGTVDLGRERLDFRFEPVLVKPPEGQDIEALAGIPIPVHLTGTFAHPQWEVDVASALRGVAEREIRGQGGGLFKKLEERTGIKGLERGLRDLFGD